MQALPTRDTAPEMRLRRALHGLGLRYRVDVRPLPEVRRRADVVFRSSRVAVFVDGCFWHRCPDHGTTPKTNAAWWDAKLATTFRRDRETDGLLNDAGWTVVRVWEHDDPALAAELIYELVVARRKVLPVEMKAVADRTGGAAGDGSHP